jgi:hypothetical protein
MNEIKFTLIADGSSDKTLLKIIKWLMDDLFPRVPSVGVYADFRELRRPPKSLNEKLNAAKNYYPFDILFIHRDAESTRIGSVNKRLEEIKGEIGELEFEKTVCVIPVKMMETWLLIDRAAIKKAAGNRNYQGIINLPPVNRLEQESQPKRKLHELLEQACGLKGRNLRKFDVNRAVHRVAENISNFSSLRELKAFQVFESNVSRIVMNVLPEESDSWN